MASTIVLFAPRRLYNACLSVHSFVVQTLGCFVYASGRSLHFNRVLSLSLELCVVVYSGTPDAFVLHGHLCIELNVRRSTCVYVRTLHSCCEIATLLIAIATMVLLPFVALFRLCCGVIH